MSADLLLWILLAVVALPYVVAPVVVRFAQWYSARPEFEAVELDHIHGLPPGMKTFLYHSAEELETLGFERVGTARQSAQMPNFVMVLTMLKNPVSKDWVAAIGMVAEAKNSRIALKYVEFTTPSVDGTSVSTSNCPELPVFASARRTMLQFPGIRDLARLHRLHSAATALYGSGAGSRDVWRGQEFSAVADVMRADYEEWAERGLLFLDGETERYRPTWKGAYIATWKLLWPVKWVFRFRRWVGARNQLTRLES